MSRIQKWILVAIATVLVLTLTALVSPTKKIPLTSGGYITVTKASFLRSCFSEAHCSISFSDTHGAAGNLVLWQDIFDGPVMVISSANTNVLLCLYDYDACYRLFRIRTDKSFTPLPTDSDIRSILFSCTSEIEDGTGNWNEVLTHLQNISASDFAQQTLSVGFREYHSPAELLTVLKRPGAMYAR